MDERTIKETLLKGERVTLECKKAKAEVPKSIWQTYSAFANTIGGTILLGVLHAPSPETATVNATANAPVNAPVKKKGYIRRIGEDKNGHWEVLISIEDCNK